MQIFDDPRRLRLSGMAAAGADVQPQLRLLMLAEALAAPPTHRALDLSRDSRPVYRRQRGRAAAAGLAVRDALPCPAARGTAPQFVAGGGAVRAAVRAARRAGRGHAAAGRRGGGGGVPRGFRLRDARRHPALAAPRSRAYRRSLLGHLFPRAWAQRGRSPSPTFCRRSAPAAGPPRYPA